MTRSRRAGLSRDQARQQPLYARMLGLQYLAPSGFLCFAFLEGAVALGFLLALAELVSWWGVLVLPVTVAVMVKLNDVVAGALIRPAVRERARVLSESSGRPGARSGGTSPAGAPGGVGGVRRGAADVVGGGVSISGARGVSAGPGAMAGSEIRVYSGMGVYSGRRPYSRDAGIPSVRDAGIPGFRDAGIPSVRDAGIPGFRDTGTPDSRDAGAPDLRDAGIPVDRDRGTGGLSGGSGLAGGLGGASRGQGLGGRADSPDDPRAPGASRTSSDPRICGEPRFPGDPRISGLSGASAGPGVPAAVDGSSSFGGSRTPGAFGSSYASARYVPAPGASTSPSSVPPASAAGASIPSAVASSASALDVSAPSVSAPDALSPDALASDALARDVPGGATVRLPASASTQAGGPIWADGPPPLRPAVAREAPAAEPAAQPAEDSDRWPHQPIDASALNGPPAVRHWTEPLDDSQRRARQSAARRYE